MRRKTDSWRLTALTLFAAVISVLFPLAGTASACPHHNSSQIQAHTFSPQHELTVRQDEPASATRDHASLAVHGDGGTQAECLRMRHNSASDCSTCCGMGETAAQRPREVGVIGEKPAQAFVPSILAADPTAAAAPLAYLFPARSWHEFGNRTSRSRLVAISRRLRL